MMIEVNVIKDITVFIIAIIYHEAGHIFYDIIKDKKIPKISFEFGAIMITSDYEFTQSIKHKITNHLTGIFTGFIPYIALDPSMFSWMAYFLACSADYFMILVLRYNVKEQKLSLNNPVNYIRCDNCKK